jgi:CheY-like chemotaxis protein
MTPYTLYSCHVPALKLRNQKLKLRWRSLPSLDKEGPTKPIEIFYSYAHEDERFRSKLEKHLSILKKQGLIKDWHDRKIISGQKWADEINTHINIAQIILLLISDDFLASDYCWGVEIKRVMERHEAGEVIVIPIILRPVDWEGTLFAKLQALPTDAKPITQWRKLDEAFLDIARGIRKAVKELNEKDKTVLSEKKTRVDQDKIKVTDTEAQILLVEDQMSHISLIMMGMKPYAPRYSFTPVTDGVEALAMVKKRSFDLIILDLALPQIGGLEVIRQLRMEGNNIPILILSNATHSVIARGLSLGADDYVSKPYKFFYLIEHIDALLQKNLKK